MKRKSLFFFMFLLFFLLNFNFTILRSLRSTLAVVDLGSGAHSLPIFELFGAMPAAILMTWALARLLSRFSIERVFLLTLSTFLLFFFSFTSLLYPYLASVRESSLLVVPISSMLFYVMSELWKPALATILFWGLINRYIPIDEAKKLYAPLILGGSLGATAAGPFISFCTSDHFLIGATNRWAVAMGALVTLLLAVGVAIAFLYLLLWKKLSGGQENQSERRESVSLQESLSTCITSPKLRLLSWIMIIEYIAYSLGEVIFLDLLRAKYPEASSYCGFMGHLAFFSGALTIFGSLTIAPFVLQRLSWTTAALVTPICLLITEGAFFFSLVSEGLFTSWLSLSHAEWLSLVVVIGAAEYCICRGAKYTFFDSAKELSFVLMPKEERMRGKLIVDGISARIGRGGASVISILLIQLSGGVLASAPLAATIALSAGVSWVLSTLRLGKLIDQPKEKELAI